jgi:hypothetical protein
VFAFKRAWPQDRYDAASGDLHVDILIVRKYANPEPTAVVN